ncbi:hypothetical protein AB0H12_16370 [Actinosynnema sp. NPDC023794]
MVAYAAAGVPLLWTIRRKGNDPGLELTAHRLHEEPVRRGEHRGVRRTTTVTAAPVPITLDLADLVF